MEHEKLLKFMRRLGNRILLGVALFLIGSVAVVTTVEAEEVVVNLGITQQAVSKNALRAIFGMRLRTWPDDTPITVYVLRDDNPLHIEFSKKILNVYPHQLRRAWDRLVYSGTGQAPIEVNSEEDMVRRVAVTRGAIGYVKGDKSYDGVRILVVQ